jgi:hypothetical protein
MAAPSPFLTLGFAAVDWIEHFLVHGPGDVQGQPIELDDEIAAFFMKAYEVDRHGERKVRRAFFSRAKGRSKSGTVAAPAACFEALGPARFDHFAEEGEVSYWGYEYEPGEPVGKPLVYAEILNVATEEGQAGNTYDAIHYMLHPDTCSPELLAEFGRLDVGLTRINLPNKRGFIEPVTSADTSKDGGKSTFIVADETHLWILGRLKRLHGIMTRNLLKRKVASGWMLETSTMYAEGENSVAEGTHAYAQRAGDKTLLFDHRQASEKWDLHKRVERLKALREAYGPASEWMNLDAIADSWDDPQVSEADFRRYWLNQPVPTIEPRQIIMPAWPLCVSAKPSPQPTALGLAMDPDRVWLSLGAATDGEVPHIGSVMRVRMDVGKGKLLAEAARISTKLSIPVAIDPKDAGANLEDDLAELGVSVDRGNLVRAAFDEYVQACGDVFDAVAAKELEHGDYADLNDAVAAAGWRKTAGRRTWVGETGDASMLKAATLAHWAALNAPVYDVMSSAW